MVCACKGVEPRARVARDQPPSHNRTRRPALCLKST
jgi:hypothetical protein